MVLMGRIGYDGDGLMVSSQAMATQIKILNIHTDNIANFGVPGYQRQDPVITSFAEVLGHEGVEAATNTSIGRLRKSGTTTDLALNTQGYFQRLNTDGTIDLSRDGRFKIDKDGFLLSLDNKRLLSSAGTTMQLPVIPRDLEKQIKVSPTGDMYVYDSKKSKLAYVGRFGIANKDGSPAEKVELLQGYVEDSNVYLQHEYMAVMPLRRQFEANRQLFMVQSETLNRMIQELGRAQ